MGCGCKNNQQTQPVLPEGQQVTQQQNENVQKAVNQTIEKYYQQKTKGLEYLDIPNHSIQFLGELKLSTNEKIFIGDSAGLCIRL